MSNDQFDTMLSTLPSNIQSVARRYVNWKDRQASMFGKLLLSYGYEAYMNEKFDWSTFEIIDRFEKPFIGGELDFNISHAGDVVCCAFSNSHKVGVDVEVMKPVNLDDYHLAFTKTEMNNILKNDDVQREFFRFWTMKESTLKLLGAGLSGKLKEFSFNFDYEKPFVGINYLNHKYYSYELNLDLCEGHIGHVTSTCKQEVNCKLIEVKDLI